MSEEWWPNLAFALCQAGESETIYDTILLVLTSKLETVVDSSALNVRLVPGSLLKSRRSPWEQGYASILNYYFLVMCMF